MDLPTALPPLHQKTSEVGRDYEKRALALIARAGWLNAEQIQYGLNIASSTTVQRLLARLVEKNELERTRPSGRMHAYSLAAAGARSLEAAGAKGVSLIDSTKIARTVRHRLVANTAVLKAMKHVAVARVWFEREIAAGLVSVPAFEKLPDGLYVGKSGEAAWVEVETSSRSTASWGALLEFLAKLFEPMTMCRLSTGELVKTVVFLCDGPTAFRAELEKRLRLLSGSAAERYAVKQLGVQDNGQRHHSVRQLKTGEAAYILSRCEFLALADFQHPD